MSVTYKRLSDGTVISIMDDDPDYIARKTKEAELEIARKRKEDAAISFRASPEFQPSESDFVTEETALGKLSEYGEAVMRTGGRAGRGVLAGLVSIPTELSKSIGFGLESLGVEEGSEIVDRANSFKEAFAPDVTDLGLWGEVPKALVQFGVPGAAVLKVLGNSNKATKLMAVAAAEGLVAEEDMKSFGDTFLPNPVTKTKELERLDAQERAFASLYNKGVNGLEAAALLAGIPLAMTATGAVIKTGAKGAALIPGVKQVGQGLYAVGKGFSKVVEKAEKDKGLLGLGGAVGFIAPKLRFRGELPDNVVAEIKALKATELSALGHANLVALSDLDETFKQAIRSGNANGSDAEKVMDALNDFLFPTETLTSAGKEVQASADTIRNSAAKVLIEADKKFGFVKGDKLSLNTNPENIRSKYSLFRAATNARDSIDEYSKQIAKNPEFLPEGAQDTIEGQLGLYGASQYRAFIDGEYVPSVQDTERAIEFIKETSKAMGKNVDEGEALSILTQLKNKSGFNNKDLTPKDLLAEDTLKSILQGPLKAKTLQSPELKAYLGEYTGRKNIGSKVQTFSERKAGLINKVSETLGRQSAIIAKSKFFERLDEYNKNLPEGRKMFTDNAPKSAAIDEEYVQLPDNIGYGPLKGKWVRKEYIQALESQNINFVQGMNLFQPLYAFLLGSKGMYQKAQTVYNPTGQIRNVTSALGFLVLQGNIPTAKNITETFRLIYGNLDPKDPNTSKIVKETLSDYSRRGIIGTQAQLGELKSLIEQASEIGGPIGSIFKASKNQERNLFARLYSAGDDVWKAMNFEIERKKLLGIAQKAALKDRPFTMKPQTVDQQNIAKYFGLDPDNVDIVALSRIDKSKIGKDFIDRYGEYDPSTGKKVANPLKEYMSLEAETITKNNIPNYARTPQAVDALRQLPFGNFIAYPSELIRTGMNTIGRGISELSSNNADIRARGIERLLGTAAIGYAAPKGLEQFSVAMTGSNEEQIEAYKRSFAFDWEKNSTFAVTRTNKDGDIKEMSNASYSFPYDYLIRPSEAVINAYNNGVRSEQELSEIALNAGLGAATEILSPFIGQSMLFDRIGAGLTGRTSQGYTIYEDKAALGDRVWAAMAHVINGYIPAGSPLELNTKVSPMDSKNFDPLRSFTFGNLSQALLNESEMISKDRLSSISERKKKLDLYDEAFQSVTSIKFMETDVKKKLGYKLQESKGQMGAVKAIYQSLQKEYGSRLPEEILYRFQKSNAQNFKAVRDLSIAFDDARTLGLTEEQIAEVVRDVGGVPGWRSVFNHIYIPISPKASVTNELYRAAVDKRRNVSPLAEMEEEVGRSYREDILPARPTPQPRPTPLTETLPEQIKEAVESIPDNLSGLYNRASRFLREQEEEKLLGGR